MAFRVAPSETWQSPSEVALSSHPETAECCMEIPKLGQSQIPYKSSEDGSVHDIRVLLYLLPKQGSVQEIIGESKTIEPLLLGFVPSAATQSSSQLKKHARPINMNYWSTCQNYNFSVWEFYDIRDRRESKVINPFLQQETKWSARKFIEHQVWVRYLAEHSLTQGHRGKDGSWGAIPGVSQHHTQTGF